MFVLLDNGKVQKKYLMSQKLFEVIENVVRQLLYVALLVTISMWTIGSDSYRQVESIKTSIKVRQDFFFNYLFNPKPILHLA